MTWTKLSDDFGDDCWHLSDAAFRLHVEGLCWNNRKLCDLVITVDDLRRFAKNPDAAVIAELLDVGWWAEGGDGFVIRHQGLYQRTREQVIKRQEVNQKNGRKGGRPPLPKGAKNPVANRIAKPPANPQGQARTGQALEGTDSLGEQEVVVIWPEPARPGEGLPPAVAEDRG